MSWSGGGYFGVRLNTPAKPNAGGCGPARPGNAPAARTVGVAVARSDGNAAARSDGNGVPAAGAVSLSAVPSLPPRRPIPAPELARLRQIARDHYAHGRLEKARAAQTDLLLLSRYGEVDDYLFAALLHHAAGQFRDGVSVLQDAGTYWPEHPAIQENLAVLLLKTDQPAASINACEQARRLGSDSPNVLDILSEAHCRLGRPDLAIEAGRQALLAKDRRFGQAPPIVTLPAGAPPPFNPGRPEENVIAYSLWGNDPRYHVPLLESARIRPHLFPAWTMWVYHDASVDPAFLRELAQAGVRLHRRATSPNEPGWRALLWRFEAASAPAIRRFLIRDADSLLTVKERVAVDAWLQTDRYFHAMRDWFTHTDLLLAGLWGGVGGILPAPSALLRQYRPWRMENDHIDQDILTALVWPVVRQSILVHDGIFHPCLGSAPFPPFGLLPPGQHVGENAFAHFGRTC